MKNQKLTLIGAGPGDAELITLKGAKALAYAGAVLYDALVNPELLNLAPDDVPKIFVGKRKGQSAHTQEQINALIVDCVYTYDNVVRLKGGDPFVFGRGFEELQYAAGFNIETEYIPGVSSSISVAGLAGIPVTHRGSSESFWVITGTTQTGELSEDVKAATQTNATVVILMGFGKLREIAEIFKANNKQDQSIAIIQNGSLPTERVVLGTIDTIVRIAEEEKIGTPAILVIGDVVKLHPNFSPALAGWKSMVEL